MGQTLKIRKSGGASIVSLPKSALESLGMAVGQAFEWSVENSMLILKPAEPELSIEEELAEYLKGFPKHKRTEEEREWMEMTPVGREV